MGMIMKVVVTMLMIMRVYVRFRMIMQMYMFLTPRTSEENLPGITSATATVTHGCSFLFFIKNIPSEGGKE